MLVAGAGPEACAGGQRRAACTALRDARESAAMLTNTAGWMFIGAGVVGLGTLVYGLATPQPVEHATIDVAPMVGERGGGVLLFGAW